MASLFDAVQQVSVKPLCPSLTSYSAAKWMFLKVINVAQTLALRLLAFLSIWPSLGSLSALRQRQTGCPVGQTLRVWVSPQPWSGCELVCPAAALIFTRL